MTRHSRISTRTSVIVAIAVALAIALATALATRVARRPGPSAPAAPAIGIAGGNIARGGEIVASIHTDPRTFNRYVTRDSSTDLVSMLTHAKLVRLNRVTQDIEPWLAESWTRSGDGLR